MLVAHTLFDIFERFFEISHCKRAIKVGFVEASWVEHSSHWEIEYPTSQGHHGSVPAYIGDISS